MSYRNNDEWRDVQNKEFIKLLIADLRRIRGDIELHTLNYNPLNPDESLDTIYQLVKQMERDLDVLYRTYLEEWAEAVKEARGGQEFSGEEAADLELYRNLIKTREMGRSDRSKDRGRWKRHK
jgi:hypothetical protein